MSFYIVTGKLGNGKTLVTVGRIREAILAGHKVATNLDINLKNMFHKDARKINLVRLPDKPTVFDLESIGLGYDGPDYDESKFGTLVLDECGTWFNSRNWQDKSRKEVNDFFLHLRKKRWHVYLIIQDISMLDSQARDAVAELIVTCRRLDKIRIPFVAPIWKFLTGHNATFARIHRAKVHYADGLLSDVWTYRGNSLFSSYDTQQLFLATYPHGPYCSLTPWHVYGRYKVQMTKENIMRMTKIYWKRFASPLALGTGLLIGAFAMLLVKQPQVNFHPAPQANAAPVLPTKSAPVSPVKNPYAGLKFYVVGDVSGQYIFQVVWPDNSYIQLSQLDLDAAGIKVARISQDTAQLSIEGEIVYAMPKPRAPALLVAQNSSQEPQNAPK